MRLFKLFIFFTIFKALKKVFFAKFGIKKILIICIIGFLLISCVPTVVTTSFVTGNILVRDKSLIESRDDISIESSLRSKFIANGIFSIGPLVENGRVFLLGVISKGDADDVKEAIKLSWEIDGVSEVVNETNLLEKDYIKYSLNMVKDSLITIIINSKIAFSKNIKYSNYKFRTINSIVYVMGIARNEDELRKVTETIANTHMVKKVISHAIYAYDERRG